MPTSLIVNRLPGDYSGSADAMQAWNAWFDQLGDHVVERGNPVFVRTSIGDVGPTTQLGGYTLITADDLERATSLSANCPAVITGGGVEIGELAIFDLSRAGAGG